MIEEEEGYIKRECGIIWALATCEVMGDDKLDESDMWAAEPYVEAIME